MVKSVIRWIRNLLGNGLERCMDYCLEVAARRTTDNTSYTPWARDYLRMRGATDDELEKLSEREMRAQAIRSWHRFVYRGYIREIASRVKGH